MVYIHVDGEKGLSIVIICANSESARIVKVAPIHQRHVYRRIKF